MRKLVPVLIAALTASAIFLARQEPLEAQSTATAKAPALKYGDPMPTNLFVELGKALNPAIVNISTSALQRGMARDPQLDMLERFFGGPISPRPRNPSKPTPVGLGTGFVIREDGLIVTNAHVVRMADIVNVQMEEGSEKTYEAKVIGLDERADIALLKIKPDKPLVAAALGSSKDVQVGEWVAAFGNPFGHGHTLTHGVISSTGRELEEINRFPLLQTDAPINPGNSGGPLVNSKGLVIGVNSAIDARGAGIGFAIPIDEVKRILPELENRGRLRKGYIGVGPADIVSNEEGEAVGAGVVSVDRGGPAAKAGIQYGDVIVDFGGRKIRNSVELIDAVSGTSPGTKVDMKILRQQGANQKTLTLPVTVTERREPGLVSNDPRRQTGAAKSAPAPYDFGFSLVDLNEQLRDQLGLPDDLKKPVISDVEPNSAAAFIGLAEGDVILEVNRVEVKTAKDALSKMKKGDNTLKIARGNRIIVVSINH